MQSEVEVFDSALDAGHANKDGILRLRHSFPQQVRAIGGQMRNRLIGSRTNFEPDGVPGLLLADAVAVAGALANSHTVGEVFVLAAAYADAGFCRDGETLGVGMRKQACRSRYGGEISCQSECDRGENCQAHCRSPLSLGRTTVGGL